MVSWSQKWFCQGGICKKSVRENKKGQAIELMQHWTYNTVKNTLFCWRSGWSLVTKSTSPNRSSGPNCQPRCKSGSWPPPSRLWYHGGRRPAVGRTTATHRFSTCAGGETMGGKGTVRHVSEIHQTTCGVYKTLCKAKPHGLHISHVSPVMQIKHHHSPPPEVRKPRILILDEAGEPDFSVRLQFCDNSKLKICDMRYMGFVYGLPYLIHHHHIITDFEPQNGGVWFRRFSWLGDFEVAALDFPKGILKIILFGDSYNHLSIVIWEILKLALS